MLLYSCESGHTLVDNVPEWVTDDVQIEEICEYPDHTEAWSGAPYDWFTNDLGL
jgi:hypothetical protein